MKTKLDLQFFAEDDDEKTSKSVEEINAEALLKLKNNTVPKDELDKANKAYADLLDRVLNGEVVSTAQTKADKSEEEEIKELRQEMFADPRKEFTNLGYTKKALRLRELVLKNEGVDIFVPAGSQYNPTEFDRQTAQNCADVFQQCVDESDGDSSVYTAKLMSRTRDIKLPNKK